VRQSILSNSWVSTELQPGEGIARFFRQNRLLERLGGRICRVVAQAAGNELERPIVQVTLGKELGLTIRTHDAWLVDLDGTLYAPRPLKVAMAAELAFMGLPAVRILRCFRQQHELLRHEAGTYEPSPFEEQVKRTADILKVPAGRVDTVVREWMIHRPCKWVKRFRRRSLLDEITAFRAEGGRTAIVSDYPAQEKLLALGAETLFDRVIASGDAGGPKHLKPTPESMLLAASALEVEPKRCLVIGDRADVDGAAAASAGMEFRLIH